MEDESQPPLLWREWRAHLVQPLFAATIHSLLAPVLRHGLSGAMSRVGSGRPTIALASSSATGGPCMTPCTPKPAAIQRESSTLPTYGCPSPPMSTLAT